MCQSPKQQHGIYFAGEVQESRRLIEKDDGCLLRQSLGYHHFLPLTITQRGDGAVGQCLYAAEADGFLYDAFVLFLQIAPEVGVGRATHAYQLANRHALDADTVCEDDAQQTAQFRGAALLHLNRPPVVLPQEESAPQWRLEGTQGAEQRTLARPVGTQQTSQLSSPQRGAYACGHGL